MSKLAKNQQYLVLKKGGNEEVVIEITKIHLHGQKEADILFSKVRVDGTKGKPEKLKSGAFLRLVNKKSSI